MLKKSSKAHLVSVTSRFAKLTKYADWKAYSASDALAQALANMTPTDRVFALAACTKAYNNCTWGLRIPDQGTRRVKAWDAARIATLRKVEAKYGNDDDIARVLRLPIKAVRTARWKYCGPRKPRTPRPEAESAGAAAT